MLKREMKIGDGDYPLISIKKELMLKLRKPLHLKLIFYKYLLLYYNIHLFIKIQEDLYIVDVLLYIK
jgi:hypothetical protein